MPEIVVLSTQAKIDCTKLCEFMLKINEGKTTRNAKLTCEFTKRYLDKIQTGVIPLHQAKWLRTNFSWWRHKLDLATPPEIEKAGSITPNYYDPLEDLFEFQQEMANSEQLETEKIVPTVGVPRYVTWDEFETIANALIKFIKDTPLRPSPNNIIKDQK